MGTPPTSPLHQPEVLEPSEIVPIPVTTAAAAPVPQHIEINRGGIKKPKRHKLGIVALRKIRYYQRTASFLIHSLPFQRLVREITARCGAGEVKLQSSALLALQRILHHQNVRVC